MIPLYIISKYADLTEHSTLASVMKGSQSICTSF